MTGVTEKHRTGKEKQGPEQEALPSSLWQPVSHSPLWSHLRRRGGLPFSVPDSPVCRATLLKCPPKGFVRQGFCAHLSGKNVFVEKFKLKLGDSKRTQNQMQIERLQMQMVLFKGLFWQTEELWRKPSGWQVFQRSRARESFTAWRGFPSAGANFLLFKFIPLLQSANHGYSYRGTV